MFTCLHPRVEVVNVYGPTECTCICSAYRVTDRDFEDLNGYVPLGQPIPNFSFMILDQQGKASAPGEVGELYLRGPCVGLGYFNEPALTAEAFQQNPLHSFYADRVYRTGDLVRASEPDAKIHFVGRSDSQIKHQGYRIELGEIEYALCLIPGVDEAVAIHGASNGISQIIAVAGSLNGISPDQVRSEVAGIIPTYMVPNRIDIVERLPRNDNGKIDRNLLKNRYRN